jgi:hypothetical protein
VLPVKYYLSRDIEQPCAEVYECGIARRIVMDGDNLERACYDLAHKDRLQESAPLFRQGHHSVLKSARDLGGSERRQGHQQQAMRNAPTEAGLGSKSIVIVDWMPVPSKPSEQSELLLIDCA